MLSLNFFACISVVFCHLNLLRAVEKNQWWKSCCKKRIVFFQRNAAMCKSCFLHKIAAEFSLEEMLLYSGVRLARVSKPPLALVEFVLGRRQIECFLKRSKSFLKIVFVLSDILYVDWRLKNLVRIEGCWWFGCCGRWSLLKTERCC